MQAARQVGSGLLYALISIIVVVGGFSLALAENRPASGTTPPPSLTAVPQTQTSLPATQTPITTFPTISPSNSQLPTNIPSPTNIPAPTQTASVLVNCIHPSGWILITLQPGVSVSSLAAQYRITPERLAQANCLSTLSLPAGYGIYVPPLPVSTIIPCGPYSGWIRSYIVQQGDTLFHIATLYRTTVPQLQRANCKGTSTVIFQGDRLWVPNVPPITSTFTIVPIYNTPTQIPTLPLTFTPLPFTATVLPTTVPPTDTSQPEPTASP